MHILDIHIHILAVFQGRHKFDSRAESAKMSYHMALVTGTLSHGFMSMKRVTSR